MTYRLPRPGDVTGYPDAMFRMLRLLLGSALMTVGLLKAVGLLLFAATMPDDVVKGHAGELLGYVAAGFLVILTCHRRTPAARLSNMDG